ncbi:MAG: CHAT domain-containing protein [Spirulinaceae cyanobacterium SM2_1_0]|nr:CHAT domain-containing protein [Spirulinaceae cyanobacterium SM2_1_0]
MPNPAPSPAIGSIPYQSPLHSIPPLNLAQSPEDLIADIDQLFEDQYEQYAGENLTDRRITAQAIRETLKTIELETGTRAVIVYALPFEDGLQLALVLPQGTPRLLTVPDATATELEDEIRIFQSRLSSGRGQGYRRHARQLYDWLIAPLESELDELEIDTLIFSMGAGLRALPLAALHDGEQFLIEKYSLGSIPSVSLTDTSYQSIKNAQVLGMGAATFPSAPDLEPLPAVPAELGAVTQTFRAREAFLNEQFTFENLRQQRQKAPFAIVHLATHASFQPSQPENAYIQFWEQKIRLGGLREAQWYAAPTVELLTLSACETALGDRRAEMGFAGLAVQAGVKSVIASLWDVDDFGTLAAMSELYRHLADPEVTIKAEALRRAQLAMLNNRIQVENDRLGNAVLSPELLANIDGDLDFSHPLYWSGFMTVGSPW